jgi:hypothetical protein
MVGHEMMSGWFLGIALSAAVAVTFGCSPEEMVTGSSGGGGGGTPPVQMLALTAQVDRLFVRQDCDASAGAGPGDFPG